MSTKDFQKKTTAELEKALRDNRVSLREKRFSAAGSRNKDTGFNKKTRKDIARILTELRNR